MPQRSGVALLELLVTITVTAVLVGVAAHTFSVVEGSARQLQTMAAKADSLAIFESRLAGLLDNAVAPPLAPEGLAGQSDAIRFHSWCEDPRGGQHYCSVRVSIVWRDSARVVVMSAGALRLQIPAAPADHFQFVARRRPEALDADWLGMSALPGAVILWRSEGSWRFAVGGL